MQPKLKVLFIAYFFPPVSGGGIPGAMRVLKFLRFINAEAYVLTKKADVLSQSDESISCELPPERILRAGKIDPFGRLLKFQYWLKTLLRKRHHQESSTDSLSKSSVFSDHSTHSQKALAVRVKDFIYNLNYFPDQASVWIIPAFFAGRKVIRKKKIDVIFATGSPWSSLILGYLLSKLTRKPLVVDYRDPWINNPFHHTKGAFLDRLAAKLEHRIVKHATFVSLNTEPLMEEFLYRYPSLDKSKFIVLPNGFEEQDSNNQYSYDETKSELVIRHAGFLYGPRDPSVLLDAIQTVNQQAITSNMPNRWVFEQIGAVSLGYDIKKKYQQMLSDGSFKILPQVPYAECQRLLKQADLLVNIQPGTKTQVPSKIYDYLAVDRPILNITPHDGALGRMVKKYQLGACFDFTEKRSIEEYLNSKLALQEWRSSEIYSSKSCFSIKNVAEELENMFNKIVRRQKS
ncbi:TPR/glycosyl transferase domain protein [Alishewanella agri BL06]|uniref:TPR/glycosyl transferase domain protein n=1 Tax=Alishewanella agri BL06 TaxID=1195246 RepID=I9P5R1_9ALTE|nr:glycosyltransferase [Alishewanella agri]EIW90357.1 TPR/glycosyl transferase domain protein [Alishewanella agri BL06]